MKITRRPLPGACPAALIAALASLFAVSAAAQSTTRSVQVSQAPPAPAPSTNSGYTHSRPTVVRGSGGGAAPGGYVPAHMKHKGVVVGGPSEVVISHGGPTPVHGTVVSQQIVEGAVVSGPVVHGPAVPGTMVKGGMTKGPIIEGEIIEGEIIEGEIIGGHPHDDCCNDGSCGKDWCNTCTIVIPCPFIPLDDMTLFAGVQGFKGPVNFDENGSFGFHEGFNLGMPAPFLRRWGIGAQFGARATQSNLSGASPAFEDERTQTFVTFGLYHRVDWGLQAGFALDYMQDDWFLETDISQFRAELSWVYPCKHEFGINFAQANDEHQEFDANRGQFVTVEANDYVIFFYRHRFNECGTEGRIFGGFTEGSDGLIGLDLSAALSDHWGVTMGFSYLIPEQSPAEGGAFEESWNVGLSIVWSPRGRLNTKSHYRPLFPVADNGTMFMDVRP